MLVYNNRAGDFDSKLLKKFGEPSWNYQVIRFIDHREKDIIPRKDRVWTTGPLVSRMVATLKKQKRKVPNYLEALRLEHATSGLKQAAFAQHCFWTGEAQLGKLEGVVTTEAGWLDGREVTLLTYDPKRIDLSKLKSKGAALRCADKVYSGRTALSGYRKARASDQKRQIKGTKLTKLALTNIQATKVNAYARSDFKEALSWLSPSNARLFAEQNIPSALQ